MPHLYQLRVNRIYPHFWRNEWRSLGRGREEPFIRLAGGWLRTAGFEIGDHVEVHIEKEGRLRIDRVER